MAHKRVYVTAFTQGNDLLWNRQTVLSCQCAKNALIVPRSAIRPYGYGSMDIGTA